VSEPVDVYEVTGLGSLRTHFQLSAERGLSKFVGRQSELAQLVRALERANAGHGQVVAALGEAGAGKSRLFHEFKAVAQSECAVLETFSLSYGKASAYLPVIELLRNYFGIAVDDEKRRLREKRLGQLLALDSGRVVSFGRRRARATVTSKVLARDPTLEDTLPYLFALLGIQDLTDPLAQMDPQIRRRRTLDAIKRIFLRESLEQTLVLIFEDLHWIDSETQALLDLLADSIANSRVLLLVNYRPEYRHEWTNKSYYTHLRLDPLGKEGADEMLAGLLGEGAELAPLKRLIIERAEGNPFFIEEMVQELLDDGALVRNGRVKLTRPLSQLRLPSTVQRILASRIDRLSAGQKDLLQTLAVIGRESMLGVVRQVVPADETQLERMLAELQAGEFIYEQPTPAGVVYIFKHALTQEVAYNSILLERRKFLHERAAQALESIFADQLDDHVGELARHYSHTDNSTKTIEYLGRAGQQAMQRSAHADAIRSFSAAIDLVQRLPDSLERVRRALLLQLALGPALIITKGWSGHEVVAVYSRARELCGRLGNPPELFHVLFGLWTHYFLRDELRKAYGLAEELLERAQSTHDPALLMFAHLAWGDTSYQMGELLPARTHLEMAISLYDRERHRPLAFRFTGLDSEVQCLSYSAFTLWTLGYPDQALKLVNQAVGLAQAISHPYSLVFAENFTGFVHLYRREAREAQQHAEAVLAMCSEHGFTGFVGHATILRGAAMAQQGHYEEGITEIREGLAAARAIEAELAVPDFLSRLGEALMEAGHFTDGLFALAEAEAAGDKNEDGQNQAERHRIKGELLLRQEGLSSSEAESCFERALESARKQGAKTLELRATTSLARLLASRGHSDQARTMLAKIYNWFTEGFDTADLKNAKALLDELGG
jgi:predicted ATPase